MEQDDTIAYDAENGVYRTSYETKRSSPGLAVVEAVAAIEETDPLALEPIGRSVDVNAINRILRSTNGDHDTRITLSYQGYEATISTRGTVEVQPAGSEAASPRTAD